jgi:predicted SAM-dependent methyltransferase
MSEGDSDLVLRVGRQLRKVPGAARVLDARARRMAYEAARREIAGREAKVEADRAQGRARLHELAAKGGLRINVGSGPSTVQGWVNVDIVCEWDDMVYLDVTEPWPLPDGSVEAVNSEHFIEHINFADAPTYFAEAFRILRPGGVIRTSTPSLRGVIDAYLAADPKVLAHYQTRIVGWCEARNHSEMLNNAFYEWGHRHIYDVEAITEMLEEAGFTQIERAEFGNSRHPVLSGIDTHDDGELLRDQVFALDAVQPEGPP